MRTGIVSCFLLIVISTPLFFCQPAKVVTQPQVAYNKILFLAYELKIDTLNNVITANLIQQIVADGKLKDDEKPETALPNDLQILFLNADDKPVQQKVIKNPFIKNWEGIGNYNTLERVEVKQSIAEITLRINLSSEVQKVVLQMHDEKGTKKEILKHPLNN